MARIIFEIATRAVHADLWIRARGNEPQRLVLDDGGKARAELPEGRYDLFWTICGPPGCPIRVVARQAGDVVMEIDDAIRPGRLDAAGARRFSVRGREALRAAREQDGEVLPFAEALARRAAGAATARPTAGRAGSEWVAVAE